MRHTACLTCRLHRTPPLLALSLSPALSLLQDSGDADGFFRMCLKTSYKRSLKIGFDRFLAALARIVDNSAVTNDKTVPNACDLLFQYHIAPTMQGRDAWFWMGTKGSSAPGRFAPRRIPPTLDYVGTHLPLVAVQPGEQDVEVNHREGNFFSFDERDFSKYGNFRKKMELEAGEGRPAENNGGWAGGRVGGQVGRWAGGLATLTSTQQEKHTDGTMCASH